MSLFARALSKSCRQRNAGVQHRLCTSQLKPPPSGSRGRVGDLNIDPGQKVSISLPPKARVQIKRPYP